VTEFDHDYIIVGSGFGGSPCGLRLVEKGYDVLMLEQGSEYRADDFPHTNWNLKRWMWLPKLGFRGFFRLTFLKDVTILSGAGVGGGSLGYACTHPMPKAGFFEAPSWAHLADWRAELSPHYETAKRMLGVTRTPRLAAADKILQEVARETGLEDGFESTEVAIYFGEPGETVPDPYFGGEGPERTGCIECGGCMVGCRFGAKNSLDNNYLYLARKRGMKLQANTEVTAIRPLEGGGYRMEALHGRSIFGRKRQSLTARNVILAGGVLGTMPLLLRLKDDPNGLPKISDRLGTAVRTNSEQLTFVVSQRRDRDLTEGVAIGSILHTGSEGHLEPVRYSPGSGFWRVLMTPYVTGHGTIRRFLRTLFVALRHPIRFLRAYLVPDFAKYSSILLYMQTKEGRLQLVRKGSGVTTRRDSAQPVTAHVDEAQPFVERVAKKLDGTPLSGFIESLVNIPVTAHILGGCCMGDSAETGVIDTQHRVFGYDGLYVVDGSAISANPGVNPSLSILALAERAMSFIPEKSQASIR
jgi:cholesterol oxidase